MALTPPAHERDGALPADWSAEADADVVFTRPRAGLCLATDAAGQVVGRISGDYVVGFTAQYQGQTQVFADIDDAKSTIAELHALEGGRAAPA